ncbi:MULTISPECIES: hypothetical protein [unclassified Campylobacter]|uniref:hypothetical protein n=1 Tax=unclassified Campylobacter TaxID=2593542 RepID=UPI001BDA9E20|nr:MULTISPECIES: hypothetical protein [unclassified Campylobacter]MBT0881561.1 hypothetical protein [Campylobacter sp. 2018MI27]MBT0884265.1 hypothetical protein [Campylobacter sp. 2018MI10]
MNIDNLKDYKIKNDYLYSLELIRLFNDIVTFLLLICTICFIAYKLDKLPEASHTEMTEIRLRGRGEATIIVGIFFIFLFIKTNHIKRLRFVKNNDFYISVDNEKIYFETYTVDKEGLFDIAKSYKKVSETINKSDIVFRLQSKRPALAYSHIFDKDTYNTKEIENKSLNYRLDYRVARIIFFPIVMFFAILNILSSYLILFFLNGKNLKTYTIYQTKTKLVSLPFVDDLSVYFLYTEYRLKHSAISKGAYEIEHREEAQPLGEKYIAKQQKKIEKILSEKIINV